MKTDAELLRKAADLMRKRGHAKHRLEDSRGRVCLFGAISLAICGNPEGMPNRAYTLLGRIERYLARKLGTNVNLFDAVEWNNMTSRRGAEVIAALRGAAKPIASWPQPTPHKPEAKP